MAPPKVGGGWQTKLVPGGDSIGATWTPDHLTLMKYLSMPVALRSMRTTPSSGLTC